MPSMLNGSEDVPSLEPIAIVGMACRLPGSVDSSSKLWELICKKDAVQTAKVPSNRFNIDAHYHPDRARPGSIRSMGGYFLDGNLEDFDPSFFGITPVEAMWLDPQQRKMLEVSYECLESAGLTLDTVSGSNTGVYVGSFTSDYQQMSTRDEDFRHNYVATGVDVGIIGNRIGNTFNLDGPSFTINTACSSSIYAVHYACHALRAGDCSAAITGGVNLILTIDQHMNTAKLDILSPTSECHTFDATADGYGRAEGAGALYLKRLSDAIKDGDVIRGVIRSSAVNTNGKVEGMGITHPSVRGQERVVRLAYCRANLNPNDTAYFECHGTGTPVGDPIEVRAASNAMNDARAWDTPLLLGAVKANIGHSEAASGIFAIMKAALATEAATIPGVHGLKTLNPNIKENEWNVKVNTDTTQWPEGFKVRRASVSSFGYGGTNGHVIVESVDNICPWYQHAKPKALASYKYGVKRPLLIGMSAHDKKTLTNNIRAHQHVVGNFYLPDIAYTLNSRRTRFASRAFTISNPGQEATDFDLESFVFGSAETKPVRIGFIFTGQGSNWPCMGCDAVRTFPAFGRTIDKLDDVLQACVDPKPTWRLRGVLESIDESSRIDEAEISQPACTAIQVAIVDLFASWGIDPKITVGHSSGEIGAAYAAGRISGPEAILAAFFRGFAVKSAAPEGSMLAVGLGVQDISNYLPEHKVQGIVIACENSPSSVTLSGTKAAIVTAKKILDEANVFNRELRTGKAYHSKMMDGVAPLYTDLFLKACKRLSSSELEWRYPIRSMISSVTGTEFTEPQASIVYWCDNLRNRVLFDSAMTTLGSSEAFSDINTLIEIGPHSALAGPIKQICAVNSFSHLAYLASLSRGANSANELLKTAGELYVKGVDIKFEVLNSLDSHERFGDLKDQRCSKPRFVPDLPPYQWNYEQEFWYEPRLSQEQRQCKFPRHDILGRKMFGLSTNTETWKNTLRDRDVPWLKDHSLGGTTIFPGAGHLSLAVEAYLQHSDLDQQSLAGVTFRDVDIKQALVIPDTVEGIEIQTRLSKNVTNNGDSQWYTFSVESLDSGVWIIHAAGKIRSCSAEHTSVPQDFNGSFETTKLHQTSQGRRWYDSFQRVGFQYGPSFQRLKSVRANGIDHTATATVDVRRDSGLMTSESRYILHPSTIDGCLQLVISSIHKGLHKEMPWGVVPLEIEEMRLFFPHAEGQAEGQAVAWTDETSDRYFNTNTRLLSSSGQLLLDIKNVKCVKYEAALSHNKVGLVEPRPYAQVSWKPDVTETTRRQGIGTSKEDVIVELIGLAVHRAGVRHALILGGVSVIETFRVVNPILPPGTTVTACLASEEEIHRFSVELGDQQVRATKLPPSISNMSPILDRVYDLIVLDDTLDLGSSTTDLIRTVQSSAAGHASWITSTMKSNRVQLERSQCAVGLSAPAIAIDCEDIVIMMTGTRPSQPLLEADMRVGVINSSELATSSEVFTNAIGDYCQPHLFNVNDEAHLQGFEYIVIDDHAGDFLSEPTESQFDALKSILCSDASIVWLTKGVNQGRSVAGGMAQGFLRAFRSETTTSAVILVDVDEDVSSEKVAEFVMKKLPSKSAKVSGKDVEFWLRADGGVHIPRLIPNKELNDIFHQETLASLSPVTERVTHQGSIIKNELIFEMKDVTLKALEPRKAEIQVQASEICDEDLDGLKRRPRIIVGKVVRVGGSIASSLVGANVVAYTDMSFETIVTSTVFTEIGAVDPCLCAATLVTFCKAVDAVLRVGNAQANDRVLLLPMGLQFTDALTKIAKIVGFEVLQAPSDLKGVRDTLTGSAAPNLILATSKTELSDEAWRFAPCGAKFVMTDAEIDGLMDSRPFSRGATLSTTGLSSLFAADQAALKDVLETSVNLLLENNIVLAESALTIDAERLTDLEAVRSDLAKISHGMLTFRYGESRIKLRHSRRAIQFSPSAAYVLIGCLGGLGRSLTTWMLSKGCRNFVFLSRSGTDKPEAAEVVARIEQSGASARVYRTDAADEQAVANIVAEVQSEMPICGVVHAAMVLQDSPYSTMTHSSYTSVVHPKMKGALSLHKALGSTPLDFFLLMSSISATLGNPGQANYCAANSFLDSLAIHRRAHGLAASSVALPMVLDVGVVAENEGIERLLAHKGLYGIDEREMLQAFEAGMLLPPPSQDGQDGQGNHHAAHIVCGVDPTPLAEASSAAAGGDHGSLDVFWSRDPLMTRVQAEVESIQSRSGNASTSSGSSSGASFLASLAGQPDSQVQTSIAEHIIERCARILMLPPEKFEVDQGSVASYGVDSMIGVELRGWLFSELGLDVPFQTLLGGGMTFWGLAQMVREGLGK